MGKNSVNVYYDDKHDILVIKLKEDKATDTIELAEDIFAIINGKGEIIEIEIWRAKELIATAMADKIAEKVKTLIKEKA
ncbi:MAG: DUF2283 domain-containing protein [Candidatus Njordarchaeales archaeon]